MRPDLTALESRALSLGGSRLVGDEAWLAFEFDPVFTSRLLAQGRVFEGAGSRVVRGAAGQCHENAQLYTRLHPTAVWWTGLALSPDGAWRSHSWATTGQGALIETTEARVRYLGLPAAFDPIFDEEFVDADRRRLARRFALRF